MAGRRGFDAAWICWAGGTAASFAALEFAAVRSGDPGNTLSHHMRRWLGIQPRRPWAMVGTGAMVGAAAWLTYHITMGDT